MQFKTFKYFSMAALALMMAACSNEDNDLPTAQQPSSGIPFTATISTGSSAMTRALSDPDAEGKITASWAEKEQVALIYTVGETKYNTTATVSSVDSETGRATITATLTTVPSDGTAVTLIYPASAVDESTMDVKADLLTAYCQQGTLNDIANKFDVRKGTGEFESDGTTATLKDDVSMTNQYAIWKLTLTDDATTPNPIKTYSLTIKNGDNVIAVAAPMYSPLSEIYIALPPVSNGNLSIISAYVGCYTYSKTGVNIEVSKYYQSTVKMTRNTNVTPDYIYNIYTALDGDVLSGTFNGGISIAAGATVTLSGVTINTNYGSGISCEGNATIILADGMENTVTSSGGTGIQAGGEGTTLTIQGGTSGTGKLTATGSNECAGIGAWAGSCGDITISGGTVSAMGGENAAGIGSGNGIACGDITISGGTVTATGGENGAGIGSGYTGAACGKITISGGTVTATGGTEGAGIGSGSNGSECGAITITSGVTKVTATKGSDHAQCIGAGENSSRGTITIGGTVYWNGSDYENGGEDYLTNSPLVYDPSLP